VIRGAPGAGKSEAAKVLAGRIGEGVRIEVDTLRSMIIPVDWTDQQEHIAVLSIAVGVVAGFLRMGRRPVILVDTFSGEKLGTFLKELAAVHGGAQVRAFCLSPNQGVIRTRVENRPSGGYKDVAVCEKLNSDVIRRLLPGELLIDNSDHTPELSADVILHSCAIR
jgi:hypothetical protein